MRVYAVLAAFSLALIQAAAAHAGSVLTQSQLNAELGTSCAAQGKTAPCIAPAQMSDFITTAVPAVVTGISAAGSSQSGATGLTGQVDDVATVAQGTGVSLPSPVAGQVVTVCNEGAHPLRVYPSSGVSIGPLAANAYVALPAPAASNSCRDFDALSSTVWKELPLGAPGEILVVDYGATGDGVTNDTAAIQAAINAAEALSTCGTVVFPVGNYIDGSPPLTVTGDGCKLHGQGGVGYGVSGFGASLITNTATTDLLTVKPATGQLNSGIAIDGLTFSANANTRTQACLDLDSVMRWRVWRNSFANCGVGILIQATNSGADNSDWLIDGNNLFRNNVNGVKIANFVGGQGAIIGNYFVDTVAGTATSGANYGDIGVNCAGAGNAGSVRIIGDRFDGPVAPTTFAGSIATAIYDNCNLMTVMGSSFEGGPSPAIWNDQSLGNPAGRGLAITGNQFLLNQTPSLGTQTCAPVISTNTMVCGSVSGIVVGLEIKDTTNPTTFQQLSEGTHNALTGGTYVTGISGSTVTLEQQRHGQSRGRYDRILPTDHRRALEQLLLAGLAAERLSEHEHLHGQRLRERRA